MPFLLQSQSSVNLGRIDDDILEDGLKIEASQLRRYIYEDIPSDLKDEIHERSAFEFADQSAYLSLNLLISGSVYNGWKEATSYVNEVLNKILPEELRERPYLKAYILKDGSHNAFMTPSGQVFINIGLFDEIETENCLAGILAHEVAHYLLKHSAEGFVKERKGEFKPGFLFKNEGADSKFSVKNELEADSLAMIYMVNAGYNPKGLFDAFQIHKRLEDNWLLQQKHLWEVTETTHPNSENRTEALKRMNMQKDGQEFIINKAIFKKIKEASKAEILKYLLDDSNYHTCLEKAFKYHLYEPYNATYVYYVMEAIRRSCYLNSSLWKKKFIISRYYEIKETKTGREKIKIESHFFSRYRAAILGLPENSYENIEAKFYWQGEVKFITNEEAFQFFAQIGELIEAPECLLSNALSITQDKEKRNQYLSQYLKYDKIHHREFVEILLSGKITSSLPDQKLTVFDNFWTIIRQGKYSILVWSSLSDKENRLEGLVENVVTGFADRNFLYLPELKNERLNDYLLLLKLERFSFDFLISKGEKMMLHILDPMYWEILKKFEVNEIEFINCIYRDVVKNDPSLEGMKKVSNSTYDDFLNLEKRIGRHINIIITSVRIKGDEKMKKRYYKGEDRLGFKLNGYDQIQELIKEKLTDFDELEEDKD